MRRFFSIASSIQRKTVVITGAASGIDAGLAEHCVSQEMNVVLADIRAKPLFALARRLRDKGASVLPVETDACDEHAIEKLVKITLNEFN